MQKEVIQATLASDFDLAVSFEETTTICIERPVGTGSAVEFIGTETNPLLATVGLRIDPAPVDSGTSFRLESVLHGTMPLSFFTAVEESVITGLQHGNYGWQVTDCIVTMTHSGYYPRQSHAHATFDKSMSSTAGDFRQLTPKVLSLRSRPSRHPGVRTDAPIPAGVPGRCGRHPAARPRPARRDA